MGVERSYRVGIAGAGIAGLASATLLSWSGHQVTVFDQFRKPRATGSGLMLQPTGLAVLEAMGLADILCAQGAPIERLFGKSRPSDRTVLDVRYEALGIGKYGLGVQRTALFELLYDAAAAAGVTIVPDTKITALRAALGGKTRIVTRWGQRSEQYDLIVDALGAQSILSPEPGQEFEYGALWAIVNWPENSPLAPRSLEQRYEMAARMAGVLPVGVNSSDPAPKAAFFWSLKAGAYELWRKTPLERWRDEVLTLWPEVEPILAQIVNHDRMTMTGYRHRTLRRPNGDHLVHIGDSYHCTSPQLGQGANSALLDAVALAASLRKSSTIEQALASFHQRRRRHVDLYQLASRIVTPVYQSDSQVLPLLRDRIAGPLSRIYPMPRILASLVSGSVGYPLRNIGIGEIKPPVTAGDDKDRLETQNNSSTAAL